MEQLKRKPIDKEYLLSTFKDFDSDVLSKKYLHSDNELLHSHDNKEILDKLNVSDTGELLFNGNEVCSPASATAGKSAYEIAQDNGFEGTESEWLESLKGKDGTNGTDGTDGADGKDGKDGMDGRSAYEIAVQNGFTGTEQEWLDSLRGEDGVSIDAYTKKESDEKFLTAPQIWTGSNQFKFGVDADGNYGYYKAGADTVTPFKSGERKQLHQIILQDMSSTHNQMLYIPYTVLKQATTTLGTIELNKTDFLSGDFNPLIPSITIPCDFTGFLATNGWTALASKTLTPNITCKIEYVDGTSENLSANWLNQPILQWITNNIVNGQTAYQPTTSVNKSFSIITGSLKDFTKITLTVTLTSNYINTNIGITNFGCYFRIHIPWVLLYD